jgi:molybdenum cofactor synthesis domain-containing protein
MGEDRRTAALVIIGDEVLAGEVRDANLAVLAVGLSSRGVDLVRAAVLPDDESVVAAELRRFRPLVDEIIVTGGIGTTHDDITREAVAAAAGVPLVRNAEALRQLQEHFGERMTPERAKLADLPEGCELLPNPLSPASGFMIDRIWVLPGIPAMVRAMLPALLLRFPGTALTRVDLHTALPEADIAAPLRDAAALFPAVHIGSYPQYGTPRGGVIVRLRGESNDGVERAAGWLAARLPVTRDPEGG